MLSVCVESVKRYMLIRRSNIEPSEEGERQYGTHRQYFSRVRIWAKNAKEAAILFENEIGDKPDEVILDFEVPEEPTIATRETGAEFLNLEEPEREKVCDKCGRPL